MSLATTLSIMPTDSKNYGKFFSLTGNIFFLISLGLNFSFWLKYGMLADDVFLFLAIGIGCDVTKWGASKAFFYYLSEGFADKEYWQRTFFPRLLMLIVIISTIVVSLLAAYSYMKQKAKIVMTAELHETNSYQRLLNEYNYAQEAVRKLERYAAVDPVQIKLDMEQLQIRIDEYWATPLRRKDGVLVGNGVTNGSATGKCKTRVRKYRSYFDTVCSNVPTGEVDTSSLSGRQQFDAAKIRFENAKKALDESTGSVSNTESGNLASPLIPIFFVTYIVIFFIEFGPFIFHFISVFMLHDMNRREYDQKKIISDGDHRLALLEQDAENLKLDELDLWIQEQKRRIHGIETEEKQAIDSDKKIQQIYMDLATPSLPANPFQTKGLSHVKPSHSPIASPLNELAANPFQTKALAEYENREKAELAVAEKLRAEKKVLLERLDLQTKQIVRMKKKIDDFTNLVAKLEKQVSFAARLDTLGDTVEKEESDVAICDRLCHAVDVKEMGYVSNPFSHSKLIAWAKENEIKGFSEEQRKRVRRMLVKREYARLEPNDHLVLNEVLL